MDQVKSVVAKVVQDQRHVIEAAIVDKLGVASEMVEVKPTTALEMIVRIRQPEGRGPRYFLVKTSEQFLWTWT